MLKKFCEIMRRRLRVGSIVSTILATLAASEAATAHTAHTLYKAFAKSLPEAQRKPFMTLLKERREAAKLSGAIRLGRLKDADLSIHKLLGREYKRYRTVAQQIKGGTSVGSANPRPTLGGTGVGDSAPLTPLQAVAAASPQSPLPAVAAAPPTLWSRIATARHVVLTRLAAQMEPLLRTLAPDVGERARESIVAGVLFAAAFLLIVCVRARFSPRKRSVRFQLSPRGFERQRLFPRKGGGRGGRGGGRPAARPHAGLHEGLDSDSDEWDDDPAAVHALDPSVAAALRDAERHVAMLTHQAGSTPAAWAEPAAR